MEWTYSISTCLFSLYLCMTFLFCLEIFTVDFLNGLYWSVQDYKDKSRCYECGEGGHLSYECPKNVVRIFPTALCTSSCMFGGISPCTSCLMVVPIL